MEKYIYSDLVLDCGNIPSSPAHYPSELTEEVLDGVHITRLDIDSDELSQKYGRDKGRYITVLCEKIWLLDDAELASLSKIISKEILKLIEHLTGQKVSKELHALVIGLGNINVTPDAIGPLTLSSLTVTRHLSEDAYPLFERSGRCVVSAILPGVSAQRGIDAQELISPAVSALSPDIVVAVDALATRSCERLASTVQISSTGISPGAGIGNHRKEISRATLGVPVIAIGIPTVVDSSTLVYDSLQKAGIQKVPPSLEKILENGRGFFVSPKECDIISQKSGKLLGQALDLAFRIR